MGERLVIGFCIAFAISFYVIPIVIKLAKEKKLYDLPNQRKVHKNTIASLGGIGIFLGFSVGMLLCSDNWNDLPTLPYIMVACLILFFVGVNDDLINLSAGKKLIVEVIIAFILIVKAGLFIKNLNGFLGIYELPTTFSYSITLVTIIAIVNAFNLIDGVDGLAATLGIISTGAFFFIFYFADDAPFAIISIIFIASLLGFLIYNHSPARIFMGDAGALMVGLVNAILVIHFLQQNNSYKNPIESAPAIAVAILLIPLLDTFRLFVTRIVYGRSPFSADKHHLHHLLLDKKYTHARTTTYIATAAIIIIVATYCLRHLGSTLLVSLQVILFTCCIAALQIKKK